MVKEGERSCRVQGSAQRSTTFLVMMQIRTAKARPPGDQLVVHTLCSGAGDPAFLTCRSLSQAECTEFQRSYVGENGTEKGDQAGAKFAAIAGQLLSGSAV